MTANVPFRFEFIGADDAPRFMLNPQIVFAVAGGVIMIGSALIDEHSTITIGAAGAMLASVWWMGRKFQKFLDSQKQQIERLSRVEEKVDEIKTEADRRLTAQDEKLADITRKLDQSVKQRTVDLDQLRVELFSTPATCPPETLKILLVDDDPSDRLLFKRALCNKYSVDEATSLKQAVDKARRTHYDCVILDLYLPDSEPDRTVSDFISKHPAVACMAISGTQSEKHVNSAIKQGADSFVQKGVYDPAYLMRMIRLAISRKGME